MRCGASEVSIGQGDVPVIWPTHHVRSLYCHRKKKKEYNYRSFLNKIENFGVKNTVEKDSQSGIEA